MPRLTKLPLQSLMACLALAAAGSGCTRPEADNKAASSTLTPAAPNQAAAPAPSAAPQPAAVPDQAAAPQDAHGQSTPALDSPQADAPTLPKGTPVRPGTVELVSGPELRKRLKTTGKRGTLVNAWASWCGPCRREFPMLVAMKDNLANMGIDVVFVSVDEPDTHAAAVEFSETRGIAPPILIAEQPLGPFKQAMYSRWRGMLPATFLYDEVGDLRYFWGGPAFEEDLMPIIEGFLRGEAIDGEKNFALSPGQQFKDQP